MFSGKMVLLMVKISHSDQCLKWQCEFRCADATHKAIALSIEKIMLMKQVFFSLQLCFFSICALAQNHNTVNAVIGDESFLALYQQPPGESTGETLRLQTHLLYVEHLLRNKDVSYLSKQQQEKRMDVLNLLYTYWQAGIFPKNYDYPERRPCFIDRNGAICAVGYLIEQTAGRSLAEVISQKHQYDYLLDMNEDAISQWVNEYGLTLEECAMIQPTYGNWPAAQTQNVPVKTGYGIGSGFAMGINAGVSLMNLHSGYAHTKTASYIGLVSGATQIVLGLAHIRKDETEGTINGPLVTYSYKAQNNLSYLNVAAGSATVFTNAFNLLLSKKLKGKRNALNLYGYPTGSQQMTAGLSFTRTL